jgi:hypothetical protein
VVEPTPLKNMSQIESVGMMTFPTYGKINKNDPNHQPFFLPTKTWM